MQMEGFLIRYFRYYPKNDPIGDAFPSFVYKDRNQQWDWLSINESLMPLDYVP
jgi:hypothetical protein